MKGTENMRGLDRGIEVRRKKNGRYRLAQANRKGGEEDGNWRESKVDREYKNWRDRQAGGTREERERKGQEMM